MHASDKDIRFVQLRTSWSNRFSSGRPSIDQKKICVRIQYRSLCRLDLVSDMKTGRL
jgi:hypothetical protein